MAVSAKNTARKAGTNGAKGGSSKASSAKKMQNKKSAVKAEKNAGFSDMVPVDAQVLDRLFETVQSRRGTDPALSHSARLLARGSKKIAQKFGEEAVECLIEAVAGKPSELIGESADVLYHLIVMWVDAGVAPQDVWQELRRREAMSGIEEKASRAKPGDI